MACPFDDAPTAAEVMADPALEAAFRRLTGKQEDANGVNPTTGGDGAGEPTTTQTDVDTGTLGQPSPAPATTFQPEEARELAMEAMQALRDAHPGRRAAIDKAIDELTREHVGAGQLSRCRDATALLAYAAAVRELITNPF